MQKQKENSHEGITWSEMGKQNVQAKEVYWSKGIALAGMYRKWAACKHLVQRTELGEVVHGDRMVTCPSEVVKQVKPSLHREIEKFQLTFLPRYRLSGLEKNVDMNPLTYTTKGMIAIVC